jgi:hypothetical protein
MFQPLGTEIRVEPGISLLEDALELPYFLDVLTVRADSISRQSGDPLNRWEQVFIYNHLAQGGRREPTGQWKGLVELPNTVSKIKSIQNHVFRPGREFTRLSGSLEKQTRRPFGLSGLL